MKRNFEFDGLSVARWGQTFIDLHNAYDLESFGTDLSGCEAKLNFARNEYAIDPDKLPSKVTLTCTGNVRVAFNDLSSIAAPINDQDIEIAYFNEDCDWRSFLDEGLATRSEPQGLHLNFANGFVVRIFCDEVTLTVHWAP